MGRDVHQLGWNWYYEPLDFDGWIPDFVIDYGYKPVLVDVKPYTSFGEDDGLNAKIRQHKKDASKASVTAGVSIGPRDAGGFGLAVKLHVKDFDLASKRSGGACQRSPRENLPLFERHARQRRCAT